MVKSTAILGSTGSIGRQSVAVCEHLGIRVSAMTTNRNVDLLLEQAARLKPEYVAAFDEAGPIGKGEHQRFIIQADRFLAKAEAKKEGK